MKSMLYYFRVLIILLKGIIPGFASVVFMVSAVLLVSVVSLVSFGWFRFVVSGFSTCLN